MQMKRIGESLVLEALGSKVDQQADFLSGNLEVVDDLGLFNACQGIQRLQFHDHLPEADEVGPVRAGQ